MKICKTCLIEKEFVEFSRHQGSKDKLQYSCRSCVNIESKRRYDLLPFMEYKEGNKKCFTCLEIKDNIHFKYRSKRLSSNCKSCTSIRLKEYGARPEIKAKAAAAKRKLNFGLTSEEFIKMFEQQNGLCKICGVDGKSVKRNLAVDHCHSTGKIRGLLCSKCNTRLGQFNDSIIILENSIKYLKGEL